MITFTKKEDHKYLLLATRLYKVIASPYPIKLLFFFRVALKQDRLELVYYIIIKVAKNKREHDMIMIHKSYKKKDNIN